MRRSNVPINVPTQNGPNRNPNNGGNEENFRDTGYIGTGDISNVTTTIRIMDTGAIITNSAIKKYFAGRRYPQTHPAPSVSAINVVASKLTDALTRSARDMTAAPVPRQQPGSQSLQPTTGSLVV